MFKYKWKATSKLCHRHPKSRIRKSLDLSTILSTTVWWCRFKSLYTKIKATRTECSLTTSGNLTKLLTSIRPNRHFKSIWKTKLLRNSNKCFSRRVTQRFPPLIGAIWCRTARKMPLIRYWALTMSILGKEYLFWTIPTRKIKLQLQPIRVQLWIVWLTRIQAPYQLFCPIIQKTDLVSIETGSWPL